MWTQRDQLQAYQFLRRRLTSALQVGDANHPASPSRRLVLGCALGTACALLLCAGFAVVGALHPGAAQDWRKPGQVVIERETGATYVLGADGLLHPALNYTSARLLAGTDPAATVTVAARSLADVPRGQPLGIPGAPTSLPAAAALRGAPWMVCSQPPAAGPAAAAPVTVAIVGVPPAGTRLRPADLLVAVDSGGRRYLVTGGRRLRVRATAALVAIGADGAALVPVSQAWINALPAGPDLVLLAVPGAGGAGRRVGAVPTKVGQVLVASTVGGGDRYYAVQRDGLTPLTQIEAALILGNPAERAAYTGTPQAVRVSPADVAAAPASTVRLAGGGYPDMVPRPLAVPPGQAVCLAVDGSGGVSVYLAAGLPLPAGARPVPVTGGAAAPVPVADEVFVPPGGGALVREQPAAGVGTGAVYLISDQGTRYPLGGPDAVKALGYGAVPPAPLATTVLALFPLGPTLDAPDAGQVAATAVR